uniref:Uncharacterized protein n=1 Tax=Oryza brachyantha TaxID=4533 RepID=J3MLA0_ORYBR
SFFFWQIEKNASNSVSSGFLIFSNFSYPLVCAHNMGVGVSLNVQTNTTLGFSRGSAYNFLRVIF